MRTFPNFLKCIQRPQAQFSRKTTVGDRPLMMSHVFWLILIYLPTLSYFITSIFGTILGPLPTLIWDVINDRSLIDAKAVQQGLKQEKTQKNAFFRP